MKKIVFTILGISASFFLSAQTSDLYKEFGRQHQANLEKLSTFQNKNTSKKVDSEDLKQQKLTLATVMNGVPVFWQSEDVKANNASNIPTLQDGTLTGLNSAIEGAGINILIMDTGKIFANHNEFGSASRITVRETDNMTYSPHSTMVGGVIGGVGAISTAKGILPKATFDNYTHLSTSLGTNYQKLENAANVNISNHSYGTNLGWLQSGNAWYWYGDYELYKTTKEDTYSGSYYDLDANYDKIVYKNPNQVVIKSTGNYYGLGPSATSPKYRIDNATQSYIPFAAGEEIPPVNCSKGYYCIGWGALSKNIITVGAVNQLSTSGNTFTAASDVSRWVNSSAGPRRDGAIKPDISAVGSAMYVPTYTSDTGVTSYATTNGTSLSAAMITGIAGALTQVNRNVNSNSTAIFQADEMKALLTHTANEAGNVGPDVWYGWGLANAKAAAEVIINKKQNKVLFEQRTLTSGTKSTADIIAGTEPIKVTISWVDPAAAYFTNANDLQNNHSSKIINDLDLRIVDTVSGTIYYPWKLNLADPMAAAIKGDNTVDNVEQVIVDAPVIGRTYRVEVSNKGTLVNDAGNPAPSKFAIVATSNQNNSLSNVEALPSACDAIVAYPTRTKDYATIIVPMEGEKVAVYDMSGKLVINVQKPISQMLDFSALPKGVYLIHVKTKYCNKIRKIIKD